MASLNLLSSNKCFGGVLQKFSHTSAVLGGLTAKFNVFLPAASNSRRVPTLMYLSGLTCTEDNVIHKAGGMQFAAAHNLALLCPDTSPRGAGVSGEDDSYDFGTGAGFYVDSTQQPWLDNYRMYSYVTSELLGVAKAELPITDDVSVTGHSMGGHGALICFLKNPGAFKSCSAFSPIVNPTKVPWGEKALAGYLGKDREIWKEYDATELAKSYAGPAAEILIDQGTEDQFLENQLKPGNFGEACKENERLTANIRMQDGYDHSYFFIQTFFEDHVKHAANALSKEY